MNLKNSIARLLMKLPPSLLVKLSGGSPVEIGGRTLDPHFQFLAAGAAKQPAVSTLTPVEARAASAHGLALFEPPFPEGVTFESLAIPAGSRSIPARIYRPDSQDAMVPLMVFYHFGGGVIGDLETCHAFCGLLAARTNGPILSIDYRLAPEHKWPAGLNDAILAYEWGLKKAASFGAPAGDASVGGDSMGGNFAAIVCQEMKREGKPQPVLQLLIYPVVDVASETPSMDLYSETFPLSRDTMTWFMDQYIPESASKDDLRLSPLRATDLEDLAPAIVISAGFDPLVDQGKLYADRLNDMDVETVYRCYDSLAHGFTAFMGAVPAARAACEEIADLVSQAYRDAV